MLLSPKKLSFTSASISRFGLRSDESESHGSHPADWVSAFVVFASVHDVDDTGHEPSLLSNLHAYLCLVFTMRSWFIPVLLAGMLITVRVAVH